MAMISARDFHAKLERVYDYLDLDQYYELVQIMNLNKDRFRNTTINMLKSIEEPLTYLHDKMVAEWCPKFDVNLNLVRSILLKLIRLSYSERLYASDNSPLLITHAKQGSIDLRKHPQIQ